MQFQGQGKPPAGIVFDTGLRSIDDVLAFALLYGFDGRNEARVVAVSVANSSLKAAAFAEVMGRFYAGTVSGEFNASGRTLPVGMAAKPELAAESPMLAAALERRNPEGGPLYVHGIQRMIDTADPAAVIRNAFTAQHDQNCVVLLAGPASNLAAVLALPGVKDLIASKVRFLAVAAGAYPEGAPDPSIQADVAAARKLFAEWPTPVVACGREVGDALPFPAAAIEKDFAWSQAHPLVDAYRAYRPMPYHAPTQAAAAALYAARPQEGYFQLSAPGTITVLDGGRTKFTPVSGGKHRHLVVDPAQKDRIMQVYTEITSAKPVPRQSRFRPPQQQQPAQPPKPPEAKP